MSASKTTRSTSPAWRIAIRSSWPTRTVRGISLKWYGATDEQEADNKHDREAIVQASDGS
jgi:hypothetical protein